MAMTGKDSPSHWLWSSLSASLTWHSHKWVSQRAVIDLVFYSNNINQIGLNCDWEQ